MDDRDRCSRVLGFTCMRSATPVFSSTWSIERRRSKQRSATPVVSTATTAEIVSDIVRVLGLFQCAGSSLIGDQKRKKSSFRQQNLQHLIRGPSLPHPLSSSPR